MQFEMTNSTCALCKSANAQSADAYPGPSRLCLACKQLVQTILPRAELTAVRDAAPAMGALFDNVGVEQAVYANAAGDAPRSDNGHDYSGEIKEIESDFFRPEEESYYKTEFEIQPEAGEIDDFVEDFPGAPHHSLDEDISDLSERASVEYSPSETYTGGTVTQIYGAQPAPEYLPPTTAPLAGEEITDESAEANPVQAFSQDYKEAAVDPWENPLPAWDYSQSEYPVLLGPKKHKKRKKLFWIIVAGLLIASFAAGYFILSRPEAAHNDNQPRVTEPNGNPAAPEAEDNSTATATGQQNVAPEASAEAASAQAQKPNASTEFGGVGSLTLQSAAFPDEDGASEFSKKLIRAGIPAYVVPADLPRKGRWFRVRVGRFSNADDAKKYAVQSHLRAKAVGLDVDFIVVEYGKP
ncbi:MAG TPA: SPOR domain-containing protein [Blastocatellia bacterium]|nr:SPOR domain-containing protein [Blastocatellia bacterium]